MKQNVFLLDTSAILTWLEDEVGVERVDELLRDQFVLFPWTTLLEAYYITEQEQGEDAALERYTALIRLPVTILQTVDDSVALAAGRIKARYRLSFADSLIAAYAQVHGATLVHKDPEYEQLADVIRTDALTYKRSV